MTIVSIVAVAAAILLGPGSLLAGKTSKPAWTPPHRGAPTWTTREFEIGPGQFTEIAFDVFQTTTLHVSARYIPRRLPRKRPWKKRPLWGRKRHYDPRPFELVLYGPYGEAIRTVRGDLPLRLRYRVSERIRKGGTRWRARLLNRGTGDWAWGRLRIAYKELKSYKWYTEPKENRLNDVRGKKATTAGRR